MSPDRVTDLPDAEIVAALRRGDETVFAELVDAYSPGLMRMARMYLRDQAVAEEVSELLGITDGNQRVLLHRARSKVRSAIEAYLGATEPNAAAMEIS